MTGPQVTGYRGNPSGNVMWKINDAIDEMEQEGINKEQRQAFLEACLSGQGNYEQVCEACSDWRSGYLGDFYRAKKEGRPYGPLMPIVDDEEEDDDDRE